MPAILLGLGGVLGHALLGMLASLVTESFLKKAVILALEKVVKKTDSDIDDKLLQAAKEAWDKQS